MDFTHCETCPCKGAGNCFLYSVWYELQHPDICDEKSRIKNERLLTGHSELQELLCHIRRYSSAFRNNAAKNKSDIKKRHEDHTDFLYMSLLVAILGDRLGLEFAQSFLEQVLRRLYVALSPFGRYGSQTDSWNLLMSMVLQKEDLTDFGEDLNQAKLPDAKKAVAEGILENIDGLFEYVKRLEEKLPAWSTRRYESARNHEWLKNAIKALGGLEENA